MKKYCCIFFCLYPFFIIAQTADDKELEPYSAIQSLQLYPLNNPLEKPILFLQNQRNAIMLSFDDLDAIPKNYYYTIELCNADWSPTGLSPFDYIEGFMQNRITAAHISNHTQVSYMHYELYFPETDLKPKKSGNYLLKVFLDGDIEQLVFSKKFYVVDEQVTVAGAVERAAQLEFYNTHQQVQIGLETKKINLYNAEEQIKVFVQQNNRLDNIAKNLKPSFIRNNSFFEYVNQAACLFEAGMPYRNLDLRSFQLSSRNIESLDKNAVPITIQLLPDTRQQSLSTRTQNTYGLYYTTGFDNAPQWELDYALVHFSYKPSSELLAQKNSVYLQGDLTNFNLNKSNKMVFNEGYFSKNLLLKQGVYAYNYLTATENGMGNYDQTEGNNWHTENVYTIFVYYKDPAERHDALVGIKTIYSYR